MSEDAFRWAVTVGVWIGTLCFIIMAGACLAVYRVASRLQARVSPVIDKAEPIVDNVRRLADENSPKISSMTSDVRVIVANTKDISEVAKDQAHRFAEVGRDIADRSKAQIARVDAAVDQTVGQVQHAGENLKESVKKPIREASAVVAGIKAAVSSYAQGRRLTMDHITQDEEMFI